MDSPRGHHSVSHTADVICEAWGPDLAACLEEAVGALVDVYVDAIRADPTSSSPVTFAVGNDRDLLIAVLEEVVFVLDSSGMVPVGATVEMSGTNASVAFAVVHLGDVTGTGSVPKAISRSELAMESGADGSRARFLVDV